MNITDLVGQVLSHPLTTVTTLFLLFIGGSLIAIGSMGYIPAWKKDLSDTRATTCLWSGVGVLALSLFVGLASWAWKQPWPRGLVLGEFVGAFSMILVAIAAFVGAALVRSRLQELIAEEKHLKAAVEDATRHVLKGFPLIFDRALKLIEEAERELWLVNFALNFGGPHRCSDRTTRLFIEVSDVYNRLPLGDNYPYKDFRSRDFARDVDRFFGTLTDKAMTIPIVHILTVSNDGTKPNFLGPLSKRSRYKECYTTDKINSVYGDLVYSKEEIEKRMQARNQDKWDKEKVRHEAIFCETGSMPIQMLIAGRKSGGMGAWYSWWEPTFFRGLQRLIRNLKKVQKSSDSTQSSKKW